MRTFKARRGKSLSCWCWLRHGCATLVAVGLSAATSISYGQPTMTVTNNGPNGSGNLEWVVEVAPDPTLFTSTNLGLGSSLAVELSFEIKNTDLLSVSVNNTDWPINTPGNDPFAKGVTTGVGADLSGDTVFASLLSNFFTSGNPVEVLTIETDGTDCTSLSWGGHTVLGGTANEYETSLIAQAGQNFTGYVGTASVPIGDFDTDCDVDGADFLEWQQQYGNPYDMTDLTDWEANYAMVTPLQAIVSAVPEPTSAVLLLSSLAICSSLSISRRSRL